MSALDEFNKANEMGIIAENSSDYLNGLYSQKTASENKISSLNNAINISNSKIAGWRTAKTTAGKNYKKTLSYYISAEQGRITSYRAQLSAEKATLSAINKSISKANSYKTAYYYISKGTDSTVKTLKSAANSEKTAYQLWYSENGENASIYEIAKNSSECYTKQLALQKKIVDEVNGALTKTKEIYGENSTQSTELAQTLAKETLAYENLENAVVSATNEINKSVKAKAEANNREIENLKNIETIRKETEDGEISGARSQEESISSLTKQLSLNGKTVFEVAEAYKESVKMYGANCEASRELESRLLKEAAAYEVLKSKIQDLQQTSGYTREAKYEIAYTMNDYVRDNYELLKGYGYSDEEIYKIARKVSGFDELVDFNKERFDKNEPLSSAKIIDDAVGEVINHAVSSITEDFINILSDNILISPVFDTDKLNTGTTNNSATYNSVYNLNASKEVTVAEQIAEIKKFDAMKKARGLN